LHWEMADLKQPDTKPSAERDARLAKALRDNLRRRKEQARARQQRAAEFPEGPPAEDDDPPA